MNWHLRAMPQLVFLCINVGLQKSAILLNISLASMYESASTSFSNRIPSEILVNFE